MSDVYATRKDPNSERLARDKPETNPMTIKPETEPRGTAVLSVSLTLPHSTRAALPNKVSCFDSTCLLRQFISKCQTRTHFQALEGVPSSFMKTSIQEKIPSKRESEKEIAPTLVFLPQKSPGQRNLVGYSPTAGHFWGKQPEES